MSASLTTLRDRARQLRMTDTLKALEVELAIKVNALETEYNIKRQALIDKFYCDAEQLTLTQSNLVNDPTHPNN